MWNPPEPYDHVLDWKQEDNEPPSEEEEAMFVFEQLDELDAELRISYIEQIAELRTEISRLRIIESEVIKLKKHLSSDGEYCITRADGEPMSWESLVVSSIFEKIDDCLKGERNE